MTCVRITVRTHTRTALPIFVNEIWRTETFENQRIVKLFAPDRASPCSERKRFPFHGVKHECKMKDVGQMAFKNVLEGGGGQAQQRTTLEDLKRKNPPGLKNFRLQLSGSQTLNEEVAYCCGKMFPSLCALLMCCKRTLHF